MESLGRLDDPIVGIDLGTTNSLVACCGSAGPAVIPGPGGDKLLPSVVRYGDGKVAAVGTAARRAAAQFPLDTVLSAKRLMGRAFSEVGRIHRGFQYQVAEGPRGLAVIRAGGGSWYPQEVAAEILRELKSRAQDALGIPVRRAVITVPAYFDDGQRSATRDAARMAGLDAVRIINEPTAAALAYGLGNATLAQTIAVYDFGGGTFDVTILEVTPDDGSGDGAFFRVLATAGDTALGGDDIDLALCEFLGSGAPPGRATPGAPGDDARARQLLLDEAHAAKLILSDRESTEVSIGAAGGPRQSLTRSQLELLAGPLVDRTIAHCARALSDAGTPRIDRVVMVGGSTRMPLVRRKVAEFFGVEPYTALDPDLVVALGASVQGAIMGGLRSDMLLLDVIPLSLGIETVGGAVAKILTRNSSIPARAREMFSTSVDNQTAVALHVLQGEREMVANCRSLARFELKGIPPMPAGIPQVEVEFLVDANGVLRVGALEKRSGCRASVQVLPTYGLTPAETEAMERESVEHAREDMHRHRVVDLAVHCCLDIKWIGEALERTKGELDGAYVRALEEKLARVQGFVESARVDPMGTNADEFHKAKEMLDRESMRLHELAIAASLRSVQVNTARNQ